MTRGLSQLCTLTLERPDRRSFACEERGSAQARLATDPARLDTRLPRPSRALTTVHPTPFSP